MGIKNSKRKKITIILSSTLVLIVLGVAFVGNNLSKDNVADSNGKTVLSVKEDSIENDTPFTTIKDSTSLYGEEILDNKEIFSRYDKVDKKSLTYDIGIDPTLDNLSEPYFYETEQGLTLDIKENRPFEPINDKKYAKVLLGYSFGDIEEPLTREDALSKADLILPANRQEVSSKSYDDYDLVHYSSDKGEFIVWLRYERIFNEDDTFSHNNKDKIQSISYFKGI